MRIYETMFIVNPELDDESREEMANRVKSWIEEKVKGTIRKFDRWGMRQLAFRVDKFYQGDYTVVLFDAEPSDLKALEEMYRITPEILKWMVFRREDIEKHLPVTEKTEETATEKNANLETSESSAEALSSKELEKDSEGEGS